MKKKFLGIALALCTMLFASCSQDENLTSNEATGGDITISVKAPIAQSRAEVTVPSGYTLECIMQLLDTDGATVGTQKTNTVDAATGQVTFTISGDERSAAVKALFWADFVPTSGTKVYNTADLKAVTYNTTTFDLSDTDLMAACDAFCGVLTNIENNTTVTLARPFTKLTVKPTNPEEVSTATSLSVAYTAPSSYNVLTSDCTGDGTALTYTNSAFAPASGAWFTTLVFAPVSATYLGSEVKMTLGGISRDITIPAEKLPLDANSSVEAGFTIALGDFAINVTINPDYSTPAAAEMAVGSYINAKGEVVTSSADAIGIVFQLGAIGNDVPANYPETLQGKTIKGYAVALENTTQSRQNVYKASYSNTGDNALAYNDNTATNGTQSTEQILKLDTVFQQKYTAWVEKHPLTGENLSAWYIPTLKQLKGFFNTLYTVDDIEATGSDTYKAMSEFAAEKGKLFDRSPIESVYYATSTVNASNWASGVQLMLGTKGDLSTLTIVASQMSGSTKALCRPMITIFE